MATRWLWTGSETTKPRTKAGLGRASVVVGSRLDVVGRAPKPVWRHTAWQRRVASEAEQPASSTSAVVMVAVQASSVFGRRGAAKRTELAAGDLDVVLVREFERHPVGRPLARRARLRTRLTQLLPCRIAMAALRAGSRPLTRPNAYCHQRSANASRRVLAATSGRSTCSWYRACLIARR